MRLYSITVATFEGTSPYPVIEHTFYGKDRKEALAYARVHTRTDTFFGACETTGLFMGKLRCRNKVVREGWVHKTWLL